MKKTVLAAAVLARSARRLDGGATLEIEAPDPAQAAAALLRAAVPALEIRA